MLAQLVTDEAKPGSKEKWCVFSRSLSSSFGKLPNDCHLIDNCSRLRTYTFVLFKSKSEVVC